MLSKLKVMNSLYGSGINIYSPHCFFFFFLDSDLSEWHDWVTCSQSEGAAYLRQQVNTAKHVQDTDTFGHQLCWSCAKIHNVLTLRASQQVAQWTLTVKLILVRQSMMSRVVLMLWFVVSVRVSLPNEYFECLWTSTCDSITALVWSHACCLCNCILATTSWFYFTNSHNFES